MKKKEPKICQKPLGDCPKIILTKKIANEHYSFAGRQPANKMNKEEIGILFKRRREFLGLKCDRLAEMSGVNVKTIYALEDGEGNPTIQTLQKIGDILGLETIVRVKRFEKND